MQVSTDCRFQRHMLSGAWISELTVIGVGVVQKFAASLDSCVSDLLCQLLCSRSRILARLVGLTTENLVRHGNLELSNGSFKGYFVTIHSLVGHKKGVSQELCSTTKNLVGHGKHGEALSGAVEDPAWHRHHHKGSGAAVVPCAQSWIADPQSTGHYKRLLKTSRPN